MLWKVQASYINANFSSPKPHTAIEQRGPGAREASRANRDPVTAHHVRDFLLFTGQEQVPPLSISRTCFIFFAHFQMPALFASRRNLCLPLLNNGPDFWLRRFAACTGMNRAIKLLLARYFRRPMTRRRLQSWTSRVYHRCKPIGICPYTPALPRLLCPLGFS
jgi:hypothetical protein